MQGMNNGRPKQKKNCAARRTDAGREGRKRGGTDLLQAGRLFADAVQSTPGREREQLLKRFLAGAAAALVGTALIGAERLHFVLAFGGTAAVFGGRGVFVFV